MVLLGTILLMRIGLLMLGIRPVRFVILRGACCVGACWNVMFVMFGGIGCRLGLFVGIVIIRIIILLMVLNANYALSQAA